MDPGIVGNPGKALARCYLPLLGFLLCFGSLPSLTAQSWDQINNSLEVHSGRVDFLLETGDEKYIPSSSLSSEAFALATFGYTIKCPPEVDCKVVSVQAAEVNVVLGDYGDNAGIGITATISVHIPNNLSPGTRTIVMTFPGAIRLRDLVGAKAPPAPPEIEFAVTNYRSLESRAAGRWWQWLVYGFLCLAAGAIALLFEDGGFFFAILAFGGAAYFIGYAIEDLGVIYVHPFLLIAGIFFLVLVVLTAFLHDEELLAMVVFGGICGAVVLSLLALVAWWREWHRLEIGALALLPGMGVDLALASLRTLLRDRRSNKTGIPVGTGRS